MGVVLRRMGQRRRQHQPAAGLDERRRTDDCSDPNVITGSVYPNCPDWLFQFHHQPFNYFANYAPGTPGRTHLKDETDFVTAAKHGHLPAVSFVKPIGEENEHPGYASQSNGNTHLVDLIKTILHGQGRRAHDDHRHLRRVRWTVGPRVAAHRRRRERCVGPRHPHAGSRHLAAICPARTLSITPSTTRRRSWPRSKHRFGLAPLSSRDGAVNDVATAYSA